MAANLRPTRTGWSCFIAKPRSHGWHLYKGATRNHTSAQRGSNGLTRCGLAIFDESEPTRLTAGRVKRGGHPRGDEGQLRKILKNKHKSAWLHVHCYHHLLPPATQCLRGPSRCGAPTVARAPQGTRCTGLTRAAALSAGRREMPQGIQASSSFRNTAAYWKPWPRGSH